MSPKQHFCFNKNVFIFLVVGFNPTEKIWVKLAIFPKIGVKNNKIFETTTTDIVFSPPTGLCRLASVWDGESGGKKLEQNAAVLVGDVIRITGWSDFTQKIGPEKFREVRLPFGVRGGDIASIF